MPYCSYCRGPVVGSGLTGRPWPGRAAATYCCYGCLSLGEQDRAACAGACGVAGSTRGLGVRLGVGVLVVAQSMIFGLALNLHDDVPPQVRWWAQTLILCGTLIVATLLGGQLVRTAWAELRRGRVTIEALFLLTMTGAMAASLQAHLTGRGPIYFEVVSILLVVYTLGKVIGARGRAAALAGSRLWAGQLSTCRLVANDGQTRTVPVTEVRPGDTIEVNPGETIAVDGVIRDGMGFVSETPLTGEPFAVVRRPGDRVLAGSASHDAAFHITATTPGTARQIDRLLAIVDEARDKPLSVQNQADRIGRVFLPLVVLTSLVTFGYWAFFTPVGWEDGLFNAMAVLLVACPCVIGLATPIIVWSALSRLAERGLVVRSGDAIERLAQVDRVLFDKTGTLTDERFTLLGIETFGGDRTTILGWASLVEERVNHPVAKLFAAMPRPFAPGKEPKVISVRTVPGYGVEATVADSTGGHHSVQIGRLAWVATLTDSGMRSALVGQASSLSLIGVTGWKPVPRDGSRDAERDGHTIAVTIDGELAAVATVGERLRDSTPEALADFRALGLPVEVLTGDTADRAAAVGLPDTHAGLLPEDKRRYVAAGGKPLFAGDGVNDAAALAEAHVGIALSSGTDLAVSASDVTLYHGDLRVLPWAVALSRAAMYTVRRNLYCALCYNIAGMALAASGLLHPVAAVLLMVASSLTLLFSSVRFGVKPVHCGGAINRGLTPPACQAVIHTVAFTLQAVVLLFLLEPELPAAALLTAAFAVIGTAIGILWHRWAGIPHTLDMCVGMLTLGNLGMVLGWWADLGFTSAHCAACCDPLGKPWMWVGMFAFANLAMLRLGRRPLPRGDHALAMFTGGNLGMAAGMVAGGWCAAQLAPLSITIHLVGMTLGMLAGMLLGTRIAERCIAVVRAVAVLPQWITHTAG